MRPTYELWKLVEVKDEQRSTWELVGRYPSAREARRRIHDLAGSNIVSPEGDTYWFEDMDGIHTYRIEFVTQPD